MKNYISIIAMLVCNACYGQNGRRLDSLMKVMQDSGWATMATGYVLSTDDTAALFNWGKTNNPVNDRKKDTVLVFVTVTDTTHEFSEPFGTDSVSFNKDSTGIVFWVNGKYSIPIDLGISEKAKTYGTYLYNVRELYNTNEYNGNPNLFNGRYRPENNYWQHAYYLDQNKQKLSPNIVVWQSIEVNNPKN